MFEGATNAPWHYRGWSGIVDGMGINTKEKETIVRVLRSFPGTVGVKAVIFGSQASGEASFGSDIDLGLERADGKPLPPGVVADIQEAFDESSLEKRVEVVDLARASGRFRSEALSRALSV